MVEHALPEAALAAEAALAGEAAQAAHMEGVTANPGVFGPWGDLHRGARRLQRPARVDGGVWRYSIKA